MLYTKSFARSHFRIGILHFIFTCSSYNAVGLFNPASTTAYRRTLVYLSTPDDISLHCCNEPLCTDVRRIACSDVLAAASCVLAEALSTAPCNAILPVYGLPLSPATVWYCKRGLERNASVQVFEQFFLL